jgi:hypothetical protein
MFIVKFLLKGFLFKLSAQISVTLMIKHKEGGPQYDGLWSWRIWHVSNGG